MHRGLITSWKVQHRTQEVDKNKNHTQYPFCHRTWKMTLTLSLMLILNMVLNRQFGVYICLPAFLSACLSACIYAHTQKLAAQTHKDTCTSSRPTEDPALRSAAFGSYEDFDGIILIYLPTSYSMHFFLSVFVSLTKSPGQSVGHGWQRSHLSL